MGGGLQDDAAGARRAGAAEHPACDRSTTGPTPPATAPSIAIDPATGERKWTFPMYDLTDAGILTTASDLLFTGGREGYFQALDARTGALLWKSSLGSAQIVSRADHVSGRRQAVRVGDRRQCDGGVRLERVTRRLGSDPGRSVTGVRPRTVGYTLPARVELKIDGRPEGPHRPPVAGKQPTDDSLILIVVFLEVEEGVPVVTVDAEMSVRPDLEAAAGMPAELGGTDALIPGTINYFELAAVPAWPNQQDGAKPPWPRRIRSDACIGVSVSFWLRSSNVCDLRSSDTSSPNRGASRRIWPPTKRTASTSASVSAVTPHARRGPIPKPCAETGAGPASNADSATVVMTTLYQRYRTNGSHG